MKKVHYTFLIPDGMEVESIVINLKPKAKKIKRYSNQREENRDSNIPFSSDEPDEGLLYDELY